MDDHLGAIVMFSVLLILILFSSTGALDAAKAIIAPPQGSTIGAGIQSAANGILGSVNSTPSLPNNGTLPPATASGGSINIVNPGSLSFQDLQNGVNAGTLKPGVYSFGGNSYNIGKQ